MAEKNEFEVTGKYNEKGKTKPFTRVVLAYNENNAIETVLSLIGSEHKAKRREIEINEVKKPSKEATNK